MSGDLYGLPLNMCKFIVSALKIVLITCNYLNLLVFSYR